MSTPSQGISGPSGRTGLQPSLQPPSGIYAAPRQALTQMSQEQSMVNQIRKLTVRLLIVVFDITLAHGPLWQFNISTPWKRS